MISVNSKLDTMCEMLEKIQDLEKRNKMLKDEIKNRISLALKDPILQQGFELICKENAELQQKWLNESYEKAKLVEKWKHNGENIIQECKDIEGAKTYYEHQLTKAKELLNEFMRISKASDEDFEHDYSELIGEVEQFLKEIK